MSSRERIVPSLALGVLVMLAGIGCSRPEPGWQQLWSGHWTWHQSGVHWVRGVPAAGRELRSSTAGQLLRAEAVNPTGADAVLTLAGPDGQQQWQVPAHGSVAVEAVLARGRHTVTAPAGVVLGTPRLGSPLATPRLLVFILVDTLRADHVRAELMPNVVGYFAAGHRFDQAWANAPWTLPSLATLFTSRPVLDLTTPSGDLIGVPEGLDTWPDRLAQEGFSGAAIAANYTVQVLNGFGRGFGTFVVPDGHGSPHHPDASWVVARAQQWLKQHRGEDAFLYLHLMDPHDPYRNHEDPSSEPPSITELAHRERDASDAEQALLPRLYAGETRHADAALASLFAALPENALVVFTADHGEGLGEHGCWGHGLNLYQESLHVPLLLRGPGVPTGVTTRPVQLMDLAPAVLAQLGVVPGPTMLGRSLLEGGSGPLVAATFGGGPLRWALRQGDDKVILRTAPQPGIDTTAHATMEEARPLPAGAFHFRLDSDPAEESPVHLAADDPMFAPAAAAFAATAGRMIPGLQVMVTGAGPAHLELSAPELLTPVQAWATAAITLTSRDGHLHIHCTETAPLCAVAVQTEARLQTVTITPQPGAAGPTQLEVEGAPPALPGPGTHIWWNQPRDRIVRGHEDTIERLRALGYLQ